MSITERISTLIQERELKPSAVADSLNISRSNLTRWKQKEYIPSSEHIIALSQFFNISTDWILKGENSPQKTDTPADALPAAELIKTLLPVDERMLLSSYRILPDEKKIELQRRATLMAAIKQNKSVTAAIATAKPRKPMPPFEQQISKANKAIYDSPASAGLGYYLDDDEPYHMMSFNEDDVPHGADCGIRIKGTSMEPLIKDGCIAWVSYQPTIENGEIGIFIYGGESFCKKLEIDKQRKEIRLVSLNEGYTPIVIKNEDEIKTVGKVIGTISPDESFF